MLNVYTDLAIETIELILQTKYDETENRLGRAQVLQPLKFCPRTYFTFDGTIYEQVKGTPMGSPISGFIAEAVLQRLESLVFQHHKPNFWAQYVDDTFVVIERDQLLTFKKRLNAVFPDIQFTMEEEENNQLAFLDVLVCRKDCGGLKTKVFRKATNTMQVLNFNSNHPISHKRSCVRTLYRRVETHCSEPEDKIAELQYFRWVFKANGYPRNFVNRCIRKRDERPNRTDTKVWRALPYVKIVSEAVGRLLAPLGVGVAHRPVATIRRQLMKPKDPLPRQKNVRSRLWDLVQLRTKQLPYPRLAQSPGERAGPHGIRLLRRLGWSSWGVGADDAGEFVLLDRLKEVHQTAVDALRQTGQASHNVVLDNEGDTRVSSPCPRKTSSDDSVADSNLLQLAMFGEPGLAECSDVHLVAGNFPSH
ncbi:hypothetical protein SprV_0802562500 [Sparganum proliferum]